MARQVTMPKLGLTMKQAVVLKWLKEVGEPVKAGDALCSIETDKISTEVESTESGILLQILEPAGNEVEILKPICVIGAADEDLAQIIPEKKQDAPHIHAGKDEIKTDCPDNFEAQSRVLISPLAKRLAKERGLDYAAMTGSGPGGRIVKADVLDADVTAAVKVTPVARVLADQRGIDPAALRGTGTGGKVVKADVLAVGTKSGRAESVPMSSMRKTIAERMQESKQTIPHVYFRCEVDALELCELKRKISEFPSIAGDGVKVTINDLLLKVVASALSRFPEFRGRIDGNAIEYADGVHLGMAVSLENGLVVPVIRNADKLGLRAMAITARELADKARNRSLGLDALEGGVFTLTNLGTYAVDSFDAIINPPQSGILSVGRITEKAVPVDGCVQIRPRMELGLSVDHRIIDGATAGAFLTRLKELIESPLELML